MGIPEDQVHPFTDKNEYAKLLTETEKGQLDLVLLGMGPDGHTASLFLGHLLLDVEDTVVAGISDSPKPPPERLTLTFPAINGARAVAFIAAGGSKADALERIASGDLTLPAARVMPASGELKWFIDAAAAAKL